MKRKNFDTASETITGLMKIGYTTDFRIHPENECLICNHNARSLSADDFEIDAIFRFEGDSDPADEMIVYAISSEKFNLKGVVVNGYGIYSDSVSSKIVERLQRAIA